MRKNKWKWPFNLPISKMLS